tara:strand:+ start:508 stop:714 length:207 start_codon:yes stop_codon:yes gene_type:complete
MDNIIYEIYIKGWGEYEEGWYPHGQNTNIKNLKNQIFKDWKAEAKFYVKDKTNDIIVEEGIFNEGIYA